MLYFVIYVANRERDYTFMAQPKSRTEAQSCCKQNYTDLYTAKDEAEMKMMRNIIAAALTKQGIAASSQLYAFSYWVWSLDGSELGEESFWANGTDGTTNDLNQKLCVNMMDSKWYIDDCTTTHSFVCYDDELVLVQQNKTWSEALWSCRDQGWELVSVLNQNIQNWVQQRADNASSPFVWLGLRYSCTLNFWFWVSGNVSCYQKWVEGQDHNTGNEQCGITGAIKTEGGPWFSLPETDRYNFICSKSHGKIGLWLLFHSDRITYI
uniref:C-type lectin domain-containing protein n=1 Tax=Esox lucius TaxID=8010 RepID=A0A3P8XUQ0_ESOLU